MNKLQLPHAKLFYMISQLSKKQYINDVEKRILKQKTISDDIQIFQLLDKYEFSKNEDDLANGLINLTRNKPSFGFSLHEAQPKQEDKSDKQKNNEPDVQENKQQQEIIEPDDLGVDINNATQATSPVGTALHLRKYQNSLNMNNEIKKQILQPYKAEEDSNL